MSGKANKILQGEISIVETPRFLSVSMRFEMPMVIIISTRKRKMLTSTSKNITTYA
jgi:hypothetical protein